MRLRFHPGTPPLHLHVLATLLAVALAGARCQTTRPPDAPGPAPEWTRSATPPGRSTDASQPASGTRRTTLPAPAHIPAPLRAILAEKMERHGDDMNDLLWAVLFLDHETVLEIADLLAEEPRLARPIDREAADLNARLPASFFDLQDELAEAARTLGERVRARDDEGIVRVYGRLAESCVRCHTAYLNDEAEPR